jgi:hypothetical protein
MAITGQEVKMRAKAYETRILRPLLGVPLRNKIRDTDIIKQLGTERLVEQIQGCQRKWHNNAEKTPSEQLSWKAYIYRPTGRPDTGRPRRTRTQFPWLRNGSWLNPWTGRRRIRRRLQSSSVAEDIIAISQDNSRMAERHTAYKSVHVTTRSGYPICGCLQYIMLICGLRECRNLF